jgi:hypothetical protein
VHGGGAEYQFGKRQVEQRGDLLAAPVGAHRRVGGGASSVARSDIGRLRSEWTVENTV